MKKIGAAFWAIFLLFGSEPGVCGNLHEGEGAFQRDDHALAMELLLPLAQQGDARVQLLVGDMYRMEPVRTPELRQRGLAEHGSICAWLDVLPRSGCAAGLRAGSQIVQFIHDQRR